MNSLTQSSFLVLLDGMDAEELSKDIQIHLADSGLIFSINKNENITRGLPTDVVVALIESTATLLVPVITLIGTYLITRSKNNSTNNTPPPTQIIIKFESGEPLEKLDIDNFPENIPEDFKDKTADSLKFISIK